MRKSLRYIALAASMVAALAACGPATDKQREEQAIAAGEAKPASSSDPSEAACGRAKGTWDSAASHCNVTPAMCADTGTGTWREGSGCVVDVDSAESCVGFKGMRWSQDTCVITFLDSAELAQNGF